LECGARCVIEGDFQALIGSTSNVCTTTFWRSVWKRS
jgi:hypothetical protein